MLALAMRNLFQGAVRVVISTGGLAMALLLILALDAASAGAQSQMTAYIDHSAADLWVSQKGVKSLHVTHSAVPTRDIDMVRGVGGVSSVTPLVFAQARVDVGKDRTEADVVGLPADGAAGGPWRMHEGRAHPARGEAVIDESIANAAGVHLGDVAILGGRALRIVGIARGTATPISSVVFVSIEDLSELRGLEGTVSYLLVRTASGAKPETVALQIEDAVDGVTVQTRADIAGHDRQLVTDTGTAVLQFANVTGLLVGIGVMALSVYIATLSRRTEYGVLKAIGGRTRDLAAVVLWQTTVGVVLGLGLAIALTLLLSIGAPLIRANLALVVTVGSVAKVLLIGLGVSLVAALVPIAQLSRLDPAAVFRRRIG